MSINKKRFSLIAMVFAEILICAFVCAAQDFDVKIKILSAENISIKGKINNEKLIQSNRNWSFPQSIAGAENLGSRVSEFNLTDKQGQKVSFKQLTVGDFLTETEAANFQYQINLSSLPNIKAKAHVSWLENGQGILMADDFLSKLNTENRIITAQIQFELPDGWKIFTNEESLGDNAFRVKNVEKAVFAVGKNWREIRNSRLNLAISGEWQFDDAEAAKMADDVFEQYRKLFGDIPAEKVQILLARFPENTKFGRWEAETRGANLTILSSDMPFKTLSAQRLHEQLRHELFHLWIPNNLALTGNYDWFYEGFTVYEALRTGVATNQIRFEDFLSTLAEAYDLGDLQSQKISLIEASKNRLSGANSQVYARGMLIAFLCDLALLKHSKGARSINDLFREIYQKYRFPNEKTDGNTAILNVLKNRSELNLIVENYITNTENIDWKTNLDSIGVEIIEQDSFVKFKVKAKLSGKQKDLLNELGYNNWRKSSEKSK